MSLLTACPLEMTAGAKNVHDDIVVNLIAELRQLLRGSGRRPFTGDGSVEVSPGRIRRPDVGVDCGRRDRNATTAALPKLLIEVLSPSTRDFDSFGKLKEYKAIPSVDYGGLIESDEPLVCFWSRDQQGQWVKQIVHGLAGKVHILKLGIALRMDAIYDGIEFPATPSPPTSEGDSTPRDRPGLRGHDINCKFRLFRQLISCPRNPKKYPECRAVSY
jgi:Uma2 family endonuclease